MEKYTFLFIDVLVFFIPMLLMLDKRFKSKKTFNQIVPGLLLMAALFTVWDLVFSHLLIRTFNPTYVIGYYFLGIPFEEYLLFLLIPFTVTVIYEYMLNLFPERMHQQSGNTFATILALLFLFLAIAFRQHQYTFYTCIFSSLLLQFNVYFLKSAFLGRYFFVFAVALVPAMLIHAVLTSHPIIQYSNTGISGIKIGTIPFEDIVLFLLQTLLVITIFDASKRGKSIRNLLS
jgi:lycopene cyclase domain-containing protein